MSHLMNSNDGCRAVFRSRWSRYILRNPDLLYRFRVRKFIYSFNRKPYIVLSKNVKLTKFKDTGSSITNYMMKTVIDILNN
jgi:hypothetical protein